MSPFHLAPPGPPEHFEAQVISDTEITLRWDQMITVVSPRYLVCYNTLTPVCVGGPVSVNMLRYYICIYVCV